jgi:phosphatidylglycerol:prolipoprotein diacylglycerol transferase
MALAFPEIDPVIISIGPFAVRWYSLAYIGGILLGGLLINYLCRKTAPKLPEFNALDAMLTYAIVGIILGGRIGYVLFYQANYFFENPLDIIKIWQGGMSFHGGAIGMGLATFIFSKRNKYSFFVLMDLIATVAPIGIFFGRIANFINGELYGRATDVSWAVAFPNGGYIARHPSQIYEALAEGLLLGLLLFILARFCNLRQKPGTLTGIFISFYALARFFIEPFREPDSFLGFVAGPLTMGQLLSLPMLLLGVSIIFLARNYAKRA